MDRLKELGTWIVLVIALYIFTNVIIYICLNPQQIAGTIYNLTHKAEAVNEVK